MGIIRNLTIPALNDPDKAVKYALKKNNKPFRIVNKQMVLDNIFQTLESTRDVDGNIIDTRFPQEVQSYIRSFLMAKEVQYEDTGYLSLRGACYSLKYDDRLELCRNINAKFNMNLNIDEELKKSKGFFANLKTNSAMIVGGGLLGTATGAVLSGTNEDLVPNIVGENGKAIIKNRIYNSGVPFSGKINGIVNSYLDNNVLSKTLPINLIAGGLSGVAVGTIGAVTSSLYNIVKNSVSRVSSGIKNRKFIETDNELYKDANLEEAKLIAQRLHEESGIEIDGLSYNTLT